SAPGSDERLAVASRLVGSRALIQVGRSTRVQDDLLARFRGVVVLLFASVVLIGLAGGRLLTWSALQPLRDLTAAIRSIVQGGPASARVPVHRVEDDLDELGVLVNRMLDRIESLIAGMRGSLDLVA